jgi:hypothetical protein
MTSPSLAAYEVIPAFELEFADHVGVVRRGLLTELWRALTSMSLE